MDRYLENIKSYLNYDQKKFVDYCIDGHNIFLTGYAGTGKSFVLKSIFKYLDYKGIGYGKTASTGVSALNIGGSTIYSWAGIGLGDLPKELLLKNVIKNKKAVKRITNCKILFIDEVSMIGSVLLDKLNYIFQNIRDNGAPFGNMQIVLCADFLQLPVIINNKDDGLAFESEVWKDLGLKNFYFKEIVRQKDKEFSELLSNIRVGNTTNIELLNSRIGCSFGKDINPVKIFVKNIHVDIENKKRLSLIDSPIVSYRANDVGQEYHIKYFDKNCPAPKILEIKKGAQVMLLKNLDISAGLCNGSIGIVQEVNLSGVSVKFKNTTEIITRESWEIKEEVFEKNGKVKVKVVASRSQIPLKLAYASTSHKVQGATLEYAHIDISEAFECGQAYVALSRVKDLDGLKLEPFCLSKIKVNSKCLEFYENLEYEK